MNPSFLIHLRLDEPVEGLRVLPTVRAAVKSMLAQLFLSAQSIVVAVWPVLLELGVAEVSSRVAKLLRRVLLSGVAPHPHILLHAHQMVRHLPRIHAVAVLPVFAVVVLVHSVRHHVVLPDIRTTLQSIALVVLNPLVWRRLLIV